MIPTYYSGHFGFNEAEAIRMTLGLFLADVCLLWACLLGTARGKR